MLKQLVTGEFSSCRTALALRKPHKVSRHLEQEPGMESRIRGWSQGSGVDTGKVGGSSINSALLCLCFLNGAHHHGVRACIISALQGTAI